MTLRSKRPETATLRNCDEERIRVPGAIQGHGVLICVSRASGKVTHISANCTEFLGFTPEFLIGRSLNELLSGVEGGNKLLRLIERLDKDSHSPLVIDSVPLPADRSRSGYIRVLPQENRLVIELVADPEFSDVPLDFGFIHTAIFDFRQSESLQTFCESAASHFRTLSGYDRIMIYRFSDDGSGEVIAESKRADLVSYLGQRYPASDIPRQARQLYLENMMRVIPDVGYEPRDLLFEDDDELEVDLSLSHLRSVSPLHIEYLQNMGVAATLCLSVVYKDELVGMIACHHYSPKVLSFRLSAICEYFGEAFSLQFSNHMARDRFERRGEAGSAKDALAEQVRTKGVEAFLTDSLSLIRDLCDADGIVGLHCGRLYSEGFVPDPEWIESFAKWLRSNARSSVWSTRRLGEEVHSLPCKEKIAGVLAVAMDPRWDSFFLWFRGEVAETVRWAGKPEKLDLHHENEVRLSPRKSFDTWVEHVKGQSEAWDDEQVRFAHSFVTFDFALAAEVDARKRAQSVLEASSAELKRSNGELSSFAFVASHDLQEPLRAVSGSLQILRGKLAGRLEASHVSLMDMAESGARRMHRLIEGLLAYSRISREGKPEDPTPTRSALDEALENLQDSLNNSNASVRVDGDYPLVYVARQPMVAVFQNLIGNALKFKGDQSPCIVVLVSDDGRGNWRFSVSDNGIGIDEEYYDSIFEIFSRLHTEDVYEGSGVGLAICKKIIESHGGRIWVESSLGSGSVFTFELPKSNLARESVEP